MLNLPNAPPSASATSALRLRTAGIHVGHSRFAEPIGQFGALLTSLASAIQRLVAREDISVEAKAAWACYSLLCAASVSWWKRAACARPGQC
eukprot:2132674-Prymnesium_polylepis.1